MPRSRYRVGLESPPPAAGDAAPHRHRRAAEHDEHRLPAGSSRVAAHGPAAARDGDAASSAPPADAHGPGHARLEQILAESGVSPAPGRRRRRYRDEDDPQPSDDVLARVLGRP